MRESKNRYFYHIFVSPGDASGAITLNVVCWMYPSTYNCFWDRVIYLWKNRHFIIPPLHSTPLLGGFPSEYRHPLWDGKTRMVSLPMVKKFWRYVYSFWRDPRTWQTDGRTLHDSIDSACIASRGKKMRFSQKLSNLELWCLLMTYRKLCKLNWAFQRTHYCIPTIQDGWDPPSWKSTWCHFFLPRVVRFG